MSTLENGLLILDKPAGISSRQAVDRAARWFVRGTRIGHTGTLDPLATGVLVLCIGVATRLTEYVQRMEKTYRTSLRLGAGSDTDDADGVIEPIVGAAAPNLATIIETIPQFIGEIEQVPPAYSAAKVDGRRAYDVARGGSEVKLKARRVRVHAIRIHSFDYSALDLEIRCGMGTYIRALARDLGKVLGCGAYVETLRRTRVGPFDETDAITLDADANTARARLRPCADALCELPCMALPADQVSALRCGRPVELTNPIHGEVAVFDEAGGLVAVAHSELGRLRPIKVFSISAP